jgi:surfeit locus 1 family protein
MGVDYPATRSMRSGRFWLMAIAALAAALITLRLGFWQLSRASEKQALHAAIAARALLPSLDNRSMSGMDAGADLVHRRVSLHGRWLDRYTIFLDNRQMASRQGFFVVTPLQLDGPDQVILVQRGWVPRNFNDRTALPALPTIDGPVEVDGLIAPSPAKLYEVGSQSTGNIRQNLDLAGYAQETGLPLASFSVQQTGLDGDGLSRDWTPVNTGVEKHYGYAFQWFALSALIVFLFVWFQIVRRFIPRR